MSGENYGGIRVAPAADQAAIIEAARLEGVRKGLEAAAQEALKLGGHFYSRLQNELIAKNIRALKPEEVLK